MAFYPVDRYYDDWIYSAETPPPSDLDIKSRLVDRLREDPQTADSEIQVDVKRRVVVLGGDAQSQTAKRAAGDDAWDTAGVVDASNQLRISPT